jgi:MFS family permease
VRFFVPKRRYEKQQDVIMQKDTHRLVWNTTALLISYMAVAMTLPVISFFVTKSLGFSNGVAGLAVGITFFSAIITRSFSGRLADRIGGKICVQRGLPLYILACLICFTAGLVTSPALGLGLLLAGRFMLGLGDSLILVGMLSWNIALLGPQRSGIVFSLIGASVYGAIALGGPLGMLCMEQFTFSGLMLVCATLPLIGLLMIFSVPAALPQSTKNAVPFLHIIGSIWRQGVVVFAQGVGFAALGAFTFLYFAHKGWSYAGFALTCFGVGFVLMRIVFGSLPDKLGGMRVALASLAVAATGQLLLWLAPSAEIALAGAFLTGIGCSLIYPAMGTEVIRKVKPEQRGTAVGGFAIFQDVAYGSTAPIAGVFADQFGYPVVFLIGFVAALLGLLITISTFLQKRAVTQTGDVERIHACENEHERSSMPRRKESASCPLCEHHWSLSEPGCRKGKAYAK